jgi:hypothetical protein
MTATVRMDDGRFERTSGKNPPVEFWCSVVGNTDSKGNVFISFTIPVFVGKGGGDEKRGHNIHGLVAAHGARLIPYSGLLHHDLLSAI